jgi:hypothetical protein
LPYLWELGQYLVEGALEEGFFFILAIDSPHAGLIVIDGSFQLSAG